MGVAQRLPNSLLILFVFLFASVLGDELRFSDELLLVLELASEDVRLLDALNSVTLTRSSNLTSEVDEGVWRESSSISVNLDGIFAASCLGNIQYSSMVSEFVGQFKQAVLLYEYCAMEFLVSVLLRQRRVIRLLTEGGATRILNCSKLSHN